MDRSCCYGGALLVTQKGPEDGDKWLAAYSENWVMQVTRYNMTQRLYCVSCRAKSWPRNAEAQTWWKRTSWAAHQGISWARTDPNCMYYALEKCWQSDFPQFFVGLPLPSWEWRGITCWTVTHAVQHQERAADHADVLLF